jgi:hypothetical protein
MTECKELNLYKGADFVFEFTFKIDEVAVNPDLVTFKASSAVGGSSIVSKSTVSSNGITVDSDNNYLITVKIPNSETASITQAKLYYEIDVTKDSTKYREILGSIQVFESIS